MAKAKVHKIILVDDDPMSIEMVSFLLQDLDVEILKFSDGKSALNYCQQNSDILLVISDLKMPGGNGIELLKGIRSFAPSLPVFIMSGDFEYDAKDLKELGATQIFRKPILPDVVYGCVSDLIA